jgi:hypothetical protein
MGAKRIHSKTPFGLDYLIATHKPTAAELQLGSIQILLDAVLTHSSTAWVTEY